MPLRLIGAGLPRTGTSSLREALGLLLGAPVYHMSETLEHPAHAATWVEAIRGRPPDWDEFLQGYAAGVDVPFSACWRELAAAYPDAPVLLSRREDAEVWYRSMEATVIPRTRQVRARGPEDPLAELFGVMFERVFSDIESRAGVLAGYERWVHEVRETVEPHRLVEWCPGDGWEPVCRALDVPVPDRPFPHHNSTASYLARHEARAVADAARLTARTDDA